MDPISISGIVIAIIAALGAWASQRSAAKANLMNTGVSTRLEAEKEAYNRARSFDIETIKRQDAELTELRKDNQRLYSEVSQLRERLTRLESTRPISLTKLEEALGGQIERSKTDDQE